MAKKTDTKVGFFVPVDIKDQFKELCEEKGSNLSTELRMYMIKVINEQLNNNKTSNV